MQWLSVAVLLFIVASAVLTSLLLKLRNIPQRRLWEADSHDWRTARRVVFTFLAFVALAQAIALSPLVRGRFELVGVPVFLWALALVYIYLWIRCIALLRRESSS